MCLRSRNCFLSPFGKGFLNTYTALPNCTQVCKIAMHAFSLWHYRQCVVSWPTHSVLTDVMVVAVSTNNSRKKCAFYRHLSTQRFQWLFQFIVGETPKAGLSPHIPRRWSCWPVIHIARPRAYGAVLRSPPVSRWRGCPGIRHYVASCRSTRSDHTWGEGLMAKLRRHLKSADC